MKDALTLLKDAYALLQDKTKWTTGSAARTKAGKSVMPNNDEAVRFCAAGAVWGVSGVKDGLWLDNVGQRLEVGRAFELLAAALDGKDTGVIAYTNDNPAEGYDVIMDAYRKAIADNTPVEGRPEKAVEEERPLVEVR